MTTRFYCIWKGRKLYRVLFAGQELFCGALDECKRFLEIHSAKTERARIASLRTPRRRHPTVTIYRLASRKAARAAI
ncbi:MAG: hypothetical protein L6R43_14375 [Planctomycetes bacterium]|nr:hypothetical protein [Planctomycetota bacterium]